MFSIFKKESVAQDVILQDLSENQLTKVAGGNDSSYRGSNDHDRDDMKKKNHKHHHHHKHMSWCNSHYNGSCNCSSSRS